MAQERELYVCALDFPSTGVYSIFSRGAIYCSAGQVPFSFAGVSGIPVIGPGIQPGHSLMNFADFGLDELLLRSISEQDYKRPTPIQALSIPEIMTGRDVLGSAQTGTGKTAAFLLPSLHRLMHTPVIGHKPIRPVRMLILAPTRELALQIGESCETYSKHTSLKYTVVLGGVGIQPQIHALRTGVDILIATPGRLADLQQQGYVDLRTVEIFVLDEADRMLDMGFLPEIERLVNRLPEQRQTLFFSATLPRPIVMLAESILKDPIRVRVAATRADSESINQTVCFVDKNCKTRLLAAMLSTPAVTRAIVFTRTKHGADRVARQLLQVGIRAEALHGNKSQAARTKTLERFRNQRPPVLVATDVAARGLDVDGVSHVLNYDLPMEPETYVHRIGRTGRAGAMGVAVSFCDATEKPLLKAIERMLKRSLPVEHQELADAAAIKGGIPEGVSSSESQPRQRPSVRQAASHKTRADQQSRRPASRSESPARDVPGAVKPAEGEHRKSRPQRTDSSPAATAVKASKPAVKAGRPGKPEAVGKTAAKPGHKSQLVANSATRTTSAGSAKSQPAAKAAAPAAEARPSRPRRPR